jgi:Spy/CpxP family protein refolding chaperone
MKQIIVAGLLLVGLFPAASLAQDGEGRQKIESARVGYITNRLNLTPDQATQFWPIYNEYSGRKQELNRRIRQVNNQSLRQGVAEQDALKNIGEINNMKQKIADLDQEYTPRFLKVISAGQLLELQNAERTFNKILLDRLKD